MIMKRDMGTEYSSPHEEYTKELKEFIKPYGEYERPCAEISVSTNEYFKSTDGEDSSEKDEKKLNAKKLMMASAAMVTGVVTLATIEPKSQSVEIPELVPYYQQIDAYLETESYEEMGEYLIDNRNVFDKYEDYGYIGFDGEMCFTFVEGKRYDFKGVIGTVEINPNTSYDSLEWSWFKGDYSDNSIYGDTAIYGGEVGYIDNAINYNEVYGGLVTIENEQIVGKVVYEEYLKWTDIRQLPYYEYFSAVWYDSQGMKKRHSYTTGIWNNDLNTMTGMITVSDESGETVNYGVDVNGCLILDELVEDMRNKGSYQEILNQYTGEKILFCDGMYLPGMGASLVSNKVQLPFNVENRYTLEYDNKSMHVINSGYTVLLDILSIKEKEALDINMYAFYHTILARMVDNIERGKYKELSNYIVEDVEDEEEFAIISEGLIGFDGSSYFLIQSNEEINFRGAIGKVSCDKVYLSGYDAWSINMSWYAGDFSNNTVNGEVLLKRYKCVYTEDMVLFTSLNGEILSFENGIMSDVITLEDYAWWNENVNIETLVSGVMDSSAWYRQKGKNWRHSYTTGKWNGELECFTGNIKVTDESGKSVQYDLDENGCLILNNYVLDARDYGSVQAIRDDIGERVCIYNPLLETVAMEPVPVALMSEVDFPWNVLDSASLKVNDGVGLYKEFLQIFSMK